MVDWSAGVLNSESIVLVGRMNDKELEDCAISEVKYAVEGQDMSFKVTNKEFIDFFQKAPIALHWLSGTGHVLWANDHELESLGYPAEDYIGHSITEVCYMLYDILGHQNSMIPAI
jgi:hypothetical protein